MRPLNQAYINGQFVPVQGTEIVQITNPSTEEIIATATLANRDDAKLAINAAVKAQDFLATSSKADRIDMLKSLQAAILTRADDICDVTIEEYGGPFSRAKWVSQYASQCFATTADILKDYPLTRHIGSAEVHMVPVGVAALIAPWNSVAGTMCSKLASALAAGCATIIKPSEFSPLQSRVVAEALHSAGLPGGIFNIILGRGNDVGDELSSNPKVAKISFTGSTATGKLIAQSSIASMKRVSLALTGKSASIILDDAELSTAIPMALNAAFLNNGQACVAGTRLLVPRHLQSQAIQLIKTYVTDMQIGDPKDPATVIGPLASQAQYERIQRYIQLGLDQGAKIIVGGKGRPSGLTQGYFVQPTVFSEADNDMTIAREEIFGPVLSMIAYDDEQEAIRIANDSDYGLQAYVFSSQPERAHQVATQLEAGTVLINRFATELLAPFGGVKQSGIGRENGIFGLEAFLEPKAIVNA